MRFFMKKCSVFILATVLVVMPLEARVGRASQSALTATNHIAWIAGATAVMALVIVSTIAVTSANADIKK